jgi:hypothetical protein
MYYRIIMKQKGFAPIIILVLIALAVVGYFGYKNYWPKPQTLVINSPVPSATTDPTANWKTISNTFLGINIKYPQNLLSDQSDPQILLIRLQTIPPSDKGAGGSFLGYSPYVLSVNLSDNQSSVETNAQDSLSRAIQSFDSNQWTMRDSTLLSIPTKILTGPCLGYCRTIYLKAPNNKLYDINEIYGNREEYDKYLPLANQILSTFQFTN